MKLYNNNYQQEELMFKKRRKVNYFKKNDLIFCSIFIEIKKKLFIL